eukprot:GEMP01049941.1.p1 GENE.GEMP01049941.1~~GEMP01049941.1.p1  ORF type:complete len:450 (+),score=99.78 GEMP01049941.1:139-1488(+)
MAIVRLRGLPFSATSAEVARFFATLPVGRESVTLVTSPSGKHTGDAFVWIHKEDMQPALKYHKKTMGSRYVEVFESNLEEYKAAVHTMGFEIAEDAVEESVKTEPLLLVRGLSYLVRVSDLVRLFAPYDRYEITERDIFMCLTTKGPDSGMPCGEAYVRFPSAELATEARTRMRKVTLVGRDAELVPATKAEMEARAAKGAIRRFGDDQGEGKSSSSTSGGYGKAVGANNNAIDHAPQVNRLNSAWLRLRGLPYACTQQNIVDFVSSAVSLSKNDVTIKLSPSGLPDGEAFIQLRSRQLAEDVREKLQGKVMGSRTIDICLSSHAESVASRTGPYDRRKNSYGGYNDEVYKNDGGHSKAYANDGGHSKAYANDGGHSEVYDNDGGHSEAYGNDGGHSEAYGNDGGYSKAMTTNSDYDCAHNGYAASDNATEFYSPSEAAARHSLWAQSA